MLSCWFQRDLGEVNNALNNFEQECERGFDDTSGKVETHMLAFYVRGIFASLSFPYVHFPSKGATSDELYSIVWDTVQHLEALGLKVMSLTCDGVSSNRKFFKMHQSSKSLVYGTENSYSDDWRYLYFMSDVPHLLKTVRNCWANSFAHSGSRALWVSWLHFIPDSLNYYDLLFVEKQL